MTYQVRLSCDPHPFARGGSVAICAVSVMHIVQAALLFSAHEAGNATPMKALLYVFWTFGISTDAVVPVLIGTAILALFGAMCRLGWVRLLVFMPQHFFLGIMALGGLYAASRGAYLDGTAMAWSHIFVDQLPVSALFLIHTSAIIRRARDPNG